jgi:hypothetical protein
MFDRCHCQERESTGVGWLLFAMFCFAVAAFAFSVAIVCAHLAVISFCLLRLLEGKWLRALGW